MSQVHTATSLQGVFAAMEGNLSEAQRKARGLHQERENIRAMIAVANALTPPDFEAISKHCIRLGDIQAELAKIGQ